MWAWMNVGVRRALGSTRRRVFLGALLSASLGAGVACSGGSAPRPEGRPGAAETTEATGEATTAPAEDLADPPARLPSARQVHFDLLAHAHLADWDRDGLYLDFGTPARHHLSMGNWRSGWGRDVVTGNRDFTRMSSNAQVFFHVGEPAAHTIRFRLRPVRTRAVVVYLNGERVGQIDVDGEDVQSHDLEVPASAFRAGENQLSLRARGGRVIDGEEVTCEVDAIWVRRAGTPRDRVAPRFADRVVNVELGGTAQRALSLPSETEARFYVDVPEDAALVFTAGARRGSAAMARVSVRPEGGERRTLLEAELEDGWTPHRVDLGRFAGEVVELTLAADDSGEVAIGAPAILVPRVAPPEPRRARSVVLLLIDTLRASKLRPYNPGSRVETPAFDAFAAGGALFERAQAPENWTKPSVASVLTSLTPMTHGTKEDASRLSPRALMVSEVFQEAGFATGSFIANGYVSDRFGFAQGWDHYTNYIRENRRTEAENVFAEAIRWIEEHREERFFAYVQTIDPHVPYDPPDEILRRYDARPYSGRVRNRSTGIQLGEAKSDPRYFTARDRERLEALHDAEITYHDEHFGPFLERLRELGLENDILFVITSDHGEEFQEHGSWGHGHSVYQELLHVPLAMRWPGVIDGRRIGGAVSTIDIAPTLLEATGVAIPDEFEGRSLLGAARGVPRPGPSVAFSDKLGDRRVITGAGYKLISRRNLTWALFNLRDDPGEQNQIDRGDEHPVALRYLRGLLGQFLGASDRGAWLGPTGRGASRSLTGEGVQIDAEICRQLLLLDYTLPGCDRFLN